MDLRVSVGGVTGTIFAFCIGNLLVQIVLVFLNRSPPRFIPTQEISRHPTPDSLVRGTTKGGSAYARILFPLVALGAFLVKSGVLPQEHPTV
jgi:hypothetical protein